jgi:hypothetical protein
MLEAHPGNLARGHWVRRLGAEELIREDNCRTDSWRRPRSGEATAERRQAALAAHGLRLSFLGS